VKIESVLRKKDLSIEDSNLSSKQLAPNEEGREHKIVVKKT
jgi:hypothetical protein